jgi:putative MATE family efflux protein
MVTFSLPVLGSNILQSLNGTANAFWVSHVLGEAGLTATNNANQIFFMLLGTAFGVTMAANIMIGQAVGARNEALVKTVVGTSTTFFVAIALLIGAAGGTLAPYILDAMRTPAAARIDAIAYLRVIFGAIPFMYFASFVMMSQRAVGDARTPFYFALLQVGLDIVLNPLLIMGLGPFPRLGIAGSALATLTAQSVTLVIMLVHLYRKRSILVLRPREWRLLVPRLDIIRTLLVKGTPMGLHMMAMSLAAVTMLSFVNGYGVQTAAAFGANSQLWTYIQMPTMALGAAVSAMAAQNVGAGRMDRVEHVARTGGLLAVLFTGLPILGLLAAERWALLLFLPPTSPALPIAIHMNTIVLWSYIPFGVAAIFSGVVRATGAVWAPLFAMIISLWGVRVPAALFLEPRLHADAIWLSFPVGTSTTLVLAVGYYLWGGWRKARMLQVTPSADAPDTGLGAPMAEESEAITDAELKALSSASAPRTPASEAPAE